jgi:K(+)-stimulated pyrophosphate-energized sodium pump
MAGVTVSGVLWAIFQNNAGGAWDNAKKSFEAGVMINGEMTYKGSDAHKAAVTGDTIGDPFKDTSGPSMNILIKLTCVIGLVMAPILGSGESTIDGKEACCEKKEIWMEKHHMGEGAMMMGKCDMSKLAKMTKEECAKMCDNLKCSPEQKEMCLSHYDKDGKFVAHKGKACCAKKAMSMNNEVRIEKVNVNGKVSATITTTVDDNVVVKKFEGTDAEVQAQIDAVK